jgi:hypothetical protein
MLSLLPDAPATVQVNFKHFAYLIVHPITGKTISSYKKLMHDLATAKVWQMAFGKGFGGMKQGDKKMGQKGTDMMFVMTHNKIKQVLTKGKKLLMGIQCLTIAHRKRIRIAFASLLVVI